MPECHSEPSEESPPARAAWACPLALLRRRWVRWLAGLATLALVLWLARGPILRGVAGILVVDQPLAACDYVWLGLGEADYCDGDRCFDVAARLYRQDPRQRIILVEPAASLAVRAGGRPSLEDVTRRELSRRGVPADALVVLPCQAANRRQETERLGRWLAEHPDARVQVLASRFSSRRRRMIVNRALDGQQAGRIGVLALPDRRYDETNWWTRRDGVKAVMFGWIELVYGLLQGDSAQGPDTWDPDQYERSLRPQAAR